MSETQKSISGYESPPTDQGLPSGHKLPPVSEPGMREGDPLPFIPQRSSLPDKTEGGRKIELVSTFSPAGDQPQAIDSLVAGIESGARDQVLLGVTGSGKTYTMAHVIERTQKSALILAPNKTLAAQLYGEFKEFFPHNAVEYFVSYYDYYQPEAYVPRTDTHIEKESSINEQINRMRHSATRSLLERDDVIIIASVSCIYGIGSVETYTAMSFDLECGNTIQREQLIKDLVALQYSRNDLSFARGHFRVRGDIVELFPAHYEDRAWRIDLFGNEIDALTEFDPLTGQKIAELDRIRIYANSHYVTPGPTLKQASEQIRVELQQRLAAFKSANCLLEAQRLEQRTLFDLEMLEATGSCAGIENYSRYLSGRQPGHPPPTLFEYLPDDCLIFVDESHVTIPQLGGMFRGDFRRKAVLAEHGFRLPSCVDNRPLKFTEWNTLRSQSIYVSATPGPWEMEQTKGVFIEQLIRPTGLIDPICEIRPASSQVDDLITECRQVAEQNQRVLVTTLTKRMAEDLTEYMHEQGLRVRYMHSDIDTLERIEIVRDLRLGAYDILVGINLLREGLDIPECSLVAILDADKEGFLRSETSLIQTIGRAARHVDGRVLLYADQMTGSLERAMAETARRRDKQQAYNKTHNITPEGIRKNIGNILDHLGERQADTAYHKQPGMAEGQVPPLAGPGGIGTIGDIAGIGGIGSMSDMGGMGSLADGDIDGYIDKLKKQMQTAAEDLEFETAARLRDEIKRLQETELLVANDPLIRQGEIHAQLDTEPTGQKSGNRKKRKPKKRRKTS